MKNLRTSQKLTIQILNDLPIESFFQGYIILKSESGKFAKMTLSDALNYDWTLRSLKTEEIIQKFDTVYEIIESGWIVD
jgi:hypothetical protein